MPTQTKRFVFLNNAHSAMRPYKTKQSVFQKKHLANVIVAMNDGEMSYLTFIIPSLTTRRCRAGDGESAARIRLFVTPVRTHYRVKAKLYDKQTC